MLDIKNGFGGNSSSSFTKSVTFDPIATTAANATVVPGMWLVLDPSTGNHDIAVGAGSPTAVQCWEGYEHGVTSLKFTVIEGDYEAVTDQFITNTIARGDELTIGAGGQLKKTPGIGEATVAIALEAEGATEAGKMRIRVYAPGSRKIN